MSARPNPAGGWCAELETGLTGRLDGAVVEDARVVDVHESDVLVLSGRSRRWSRRIASNSSTFDLTAWALPIAATTRRHSQVGPNQAGGFQPTSQHLDHHVPSRSAD
jgi:hypothetical protein